MCKVSNTYSAQNSWEGREVSFVQLGCQIIDLNLCTASKGEKKMFPIFYTSMRPLLQLLSNIRIWDTCSLLKILELLDHSFAL